MAMATQVKSTGSARLQSFLSLLASVSERMGTDSPGSALRNFITILQSASPQLRLAIALLTPWALLASAITRYAWVSQWLDGIKGYLSGLMCASVSIPSSHPLNRQLLAYMAEQGLGKNARTLALTTPAQATNSSVWEQAERVLLNSYRADPYGTKASRTLKGLKDDSPPNRSLTYVPEVGSYNFWFGWHRMTFERVSTYTEQRDNKDRRMLMQGPAGTETIVMSCTSPFSGAKPIQDFLRHVQAIPAAHRTTTIFRPDTDNFMWDQGITRPSRYLNAVTLDQKVKDDLVKDIQTYLSPATRKYYANRGIPYRRGYLFYGTPGCGKTSFSNALAGHFGLNIYMFSLSNSAMTDAILEMLFEQLPSRCIVLLEDIDSAGLKREDMREELSEKRKRKRVKQVYVDRNGCRIPDEDINEEEEVVRVTNVTLSGLLNVLDGIRSKEGMITIMTSNSPDHLDPALVRPGRIDKKILFGFCSTEVIASLFKHIFERAPEEIAEGDTVDAEKHDIPALATTFASRVPANKLSPAEVQGFLLMHRADPVAAVDEVAEWAKKTVDLKAAGVNVDSFDSGIKADDAKSLESGDSDETANDPSPSATSWTKTTALNPKASTFTYPGENPAMAKAANISMAGIHTNPPQMMRLAHIPFDSAASRTCMDFLTPPMSRPPSQGW